MDCCLGFLEGSIVIRFALLGSGSSGNATLVTDGTDSILIDNGLSLKKLEERLAAVGICPSELKGVFVTHEHGDHVAGLGILSRKHRVPVFLTEGTRASLPPAVGRIERLETFEAGETVNIGALQISSFSIAHDAADPVSYTVTNASAKLGFATDFGHTSHLVRTRLAHSHALVIESNYCPHLLRTGSYPPKIQQRISSRSGHLSNHDAAKLLSELAHDGLQLVVLVHLSKENNLPALASRLAREALPGHPAEIIVAPPDGSSRLFEVHG